MKPARLTTVRLEKSADIMRLRDVTSALTSVLRFGTFEKTRTVTAVVEMGRNAIEHAKRGRASFSLTEVQGRQALGVTVVDQGHGIASEPLSDRKGAFLTGGVGPGLGLGLRGVQRIAEQFAIETGSEGTRIETAFLGAEPLLGSPELVAEATNALAGLNASDPAAALSEQNRALMESIADRDLLMKELHHRTGNNLSLIVALIRMSKNEAALDETKQVLAELETRVASLTKAHELMQRAATAGTVPAAELLQEVARNAERAFNTEDRQVEIRVECVPTDLDGRLAVDIGLIVGELITNAYKHAFVGREDGVITVRLTSKGHEGLELVVFDNGVGLPADAERPERSNSLGWKLIRTLTFTHNGMLTVDGKSGLHVHISLSPSDYGTA
ncbi:ATP-binding protein [Roseibium sp. CAU 1637]|uniref:histidine kinase n=1 Tax=Roseibium limicola TaxID=2816037 RepID=A0A939J9B4_9HYPH|nr:ATP-binding protein [Roseibium limicola]MBO0345218.1 ATP-binding protein [Roseibium limicola]